MVGILVAGFLALLLSAVGTSWLIAVLRRHRIGQPIHDALGHHAAKAGTPTMGGIAICMVVPLAYLIGSAMAGGAIFYADAVQLV